MVKKMNYLAVRTRLQAIVALELFERGYLATPFVLIELYQFSLNEDSPAVYRYYDLLAKHATKTIRLIEAKGCWITTMRLFCACLQAKVTGGRLYIAVINSYPLAVAVKLCPGLMLHTFDDGTANIQVRESSYHSSTPLAGPGFKRRISRILFPQGSSYFLRGRVCKHFTIYPHKQNVVALEKCVAVELNWLRHFHPVDEGKIPPAVKTIMLGTVYEAYDDVGAMKDLRDRALVDCQLYIPHPREKVSFENPKIVKLFSPAESLIAYLCSREKLVVYHFNSSAVITFQNNEQVRFIDLRDDLNAAVVP